MDNLEREEWMETASCGWFEEEQIFALRVQASRDRFDKMTATKAAKKGEGSRLPYRSITSRASSGSTRWILPTSGNLKGKNNPWEISSAKRKRPKEERYSVL
jgi:hypothetical protein